MLPFMSRFRVGPFPSPVRQSRVEVEVTYCVGGAISPLLANLYMRRFILGWKVRGHERELGARIVNYADDLVICCRRSGGDALAAMRNLMQQLKLTVNEEKTSVRRIPDESVDFLGYTLGRCYSRRTGRAFIGTIPSKASVRRIRREISDLTSRRWVLMSADDRVARLNRLLRGWSNYFLLGPVSPAYRSVDYHARQRLRRWLRAKHKVQSRGTSRFPDDYLYQALGLLQLTRQTRNFPWATA